ncbi:hypothetical protein C943_02271 [Mariniradius saccharolyticus AK6]|uniref:Uncharacterized protein n=1 Tax=Mariniradius saccharolyticus AK6 TaxID=1239962 RepID=M7YDF1_9BACT|nr:hypothetical protein C943_02271 [Mariniradius saccharolyticus AK6]
MGRKNLQWVGIPDDNEYSVKKRTAIYLGLVVGRMKNRPDLLFAF